MSKATASVLLSLVALAVMAMPFPTQAQNPASKINLLLPHTTGSALAAAKQAFEGGEILEMEGNYHDDFDGLLDIYVPAVGAVDIAESLVLYGKSATYQRRSHPALQWEAARLAPDGIHLFECAKGKPEILPPGQNPNDCTVSLAEWVKEEQGASSTAATPEPETDAWTSLGQLTLDFQDDHVTVQNRFRLFRLNDTDSASDWYMVMRDPLSTPNFKSGSCNLFTSCGWYTATRDFQISLDRDVATNPKFLFYDWSPRQEIKGSTGEISLGLSLDTLVPSAGYTFQWSQSDVETQVYANAPAKEASWVERFAGRGPFGNPPITSTGSFSSHQGVIFQVPEGTTDFQVSGYTAVTVKYESLGTEYSTYYAKPHLRVAAPVFQLREPSLDLMQNSTGAAYVISEIPVYSQRLRWTVVSKPDWLEVTPTQGAGSSYLTIRDNGSGQVGNQGYIELQTNPQYGAPSVSRGPLRLNVNIVAKVQTRGVLLAGGNNGSVQTNTAEVWDPGTHTVVRTQPMKSPHEFHTATLLPDGNILIAGGRVYEGEGQNKSEVFDPLTRTFTAINGMTSNRYSHRAVRFTSGALSGKVLLVGGCCDSNGQAVATAELYDPLTRTFSKTGSMAAARMDATATLLNNGYVLVTGGASGPNDYYGTNTAELYNPSTQTFSTIASMKQARRNHSAVRLANGQVLITGGYSHPVDPLSSAEIYTPGDDHFVFTGSMPVGRRWQSSTLMSNGLALIDGGWNDPNHGVTFDVNTGTFTQTQNAMSEFRSLPAATLILNTGTGDDGKVLLAGGVDLGYSSDEGRSLDLFNPATASFESAGSMTAARYGMTATAFGDNQ